MTDYKAIFEAIERTLYDNAIDPVAMKQEMDKFKHGRKQVGDEEFYEITQVVVFASGFRASTMNDYHPGVRKHLPSIAVAASKTEDDIKAITASGDVIGFEKKVRACVKNARAIQKVISEFGSTCDYIESFAPFDNMPSILKLRDDIKKRFEWMGDVTSFHLMTDLGLPVLKPDIVIMRIFKRLGLVYDDSQTLKAVEIGQEIARETGYPIRYIDIALVSYGQVKTFGGNVGICLENKPKCDLCGVSNYCQFYGS